MDHLFSSKPQWVTDGFLLPSSETGPRLERQQAKSDKNLTLRDVVRSTDKGVPEAVFGYVSELCRHNCLKLLLIKNPEGEFLFTQRGKGRIYIDPDLPPIQDSDVRRMDRFGFTEVSWTLAA
jgi:hypothetical protein